MKGFMGRIVAGQGIYNCIAKYLIIFITRKKMESEFCLNREQNPIKSKWFCLNSCRIAGNCNAEYSASSLADHMK